MSFSDLLYNLKEELDLSTEDTALVLNQAAQALLHGLKGEGPNESISDGQDRRDIKKLLRAKGLEREISIDLAADFISEAWLEGIQDKGRVTIRLNSLDSEDICTCGRSVPAGTEKCRCGSTVIDRQVYAEVSAPWANLWADNDQSIEGSNWECPDGSDFAYTTFSIRKGLVADLRNEGYKLDLSSYDDMGIDPQDE